MTIEYIIIAVCAAVLFLYLAYKAWNLHLLLSVTGLWRGNKSERNLILKLRKMGFDKNEVFHDLYVLKGENKYSQIDAVAVSDYGLIVFEVKNYSGWIFGNGYNSLWTQTFPNGKKNKFYNPVLQNKGHIEALKRNLKQYSDVPIFSVIIFYGSCELRELTFITENTYVAKADKLRKALRKIRRDNEKCIYANKEAVQAFLAGCTRRGANYTIQEEHIENIKDSMGSDRIFD